MLRARLVPAAFAAAVVALLPGCLTLFSKTEVIRGEEPRRPIKFESAEAADTFNSALKWKSKSMGGAELGVPFVTLYSRNCQLSDSAHFNDCVLRCDTDQDGTITLAEARMFKELKE